MKRFLATCTLNDTGDTVVAHLPNTGSMRTLNALGSTVWLRHHCESTRKTAYTLEVVCDAQQQPVGVYSAQANQLVEKAFHQKLWPSLAGYESFQREVRFGGTNSRFDFYAQGIPAAYIEVKSVQMMRQASIAEFPDAVTKRGLKHIQHLQQAVQQGYRGVLIFCAQRTDAEFVALAEDIDAAYAQALRIAVQQGVEVMACNCMVSLEGIAVQKVVSVHL